MGDLAQPRQIAVVRGDYLTIEECVGMAMQTMGWDRETAEITILEALESGELESKFLGDA